MLWIVFSCKGTPNNQGFPSTNYVYLRADIGNDIHEENSCCCCSIIEARPHAAIGLCNLVFKN